MSAGAILSFVKTPFAPKIKILAASAGKLRIHDYSTISHGSLIQSSLKNRTEPAMRRHNSIVSYQNAKPVRISARWHGLPWLSQWIPGFDVDPCGMSTGGCEKKQDDIGPYLRRSPREILITQRGVRNGGADHRLQESQSHPPVPIPT